MKQPGTQKNICYKFQDFSIVDTYFIVKYQCFLFAALWMPKTIAEPHREINICRYVFIIYLLSIMDSFDCLLFFWFMFLILNTIKYNKAEFLPFKPLSFHQCMYGKVTVLRGTFFSITLSNQQVGIGPFPCKIKINIV